MQAASCLRSWPILLVVALGASSCDGAPITPEELVGAPRPAPVLLDTSDYLQAKPYPGDVDTFMVVVPDNRMVGVVLEASGPMGILHGPSGADVVYSFHGVPVSAIATHTSSGEIPITARHVVPYFEHVTYRLRVIGVDSTPEHAASRLLADATFRRDWIDPPLDLDVFTIDFTGVHRYFVELESEDENVSVAARVVTPSGVSHFVILGTGAGLTRGAVYPVDQPGEHQLLIHAEGLRPDVQARYRFRVVDAATLATTLDER